MRTRNYLHPDDFADAAGSCSACVGRALHRGDIAGDERRHQAATDFVPADKLDVGGFEHRVGRLQQGNEALRFNHSQCFANFGHLQLHMVEIANWL